MKVLTYIQSESERQGATLKETLGMVRAWEYVWAFGPGEVPNLDTIVHICKLITGKGQFRTEPAVFNNGVAAAVRPALILHAMGNWHEFASNPDTFPQELDWVMKEFLDIHPFADGNGRVASLLYNHFGGWIEDPLPLPYYFGKAGK